MNMNLMNKMYPGATPPATPPGEVKGIDISALPNPSAPVNIQPQLQNLGPVAGQQVDVQQIANSLMASGVIPGTPTPNANQIQGSLQGQMGSDFTSTNGMNTPTSGAVMPTATASNVVPGTQTQMPIAPASQDQIPFNMLTPDQQQKRILELMMLSGAIK